jgi:hypothetical protein
MVCHIHVDASLREAQALQARTLNSLISPGPSRKNEDLALTHAAPLYQHLLANAGEYKMSGGES